MNKATEATIDGIGNAIRQAIVQNNGSPDSITLKKGAKGYMHEIKVYGNSSQDPQGLINRVMQIDADVRARIAVIENTPLPAPEAEEQE